MKKIIFVFLLMQIIFFLQGYSIVSISGQENVKKVINSKPVYMVFTANND